jgi:hypothetical protein
LLPRSLASLSFFGTVAEMLFDRHADAWHWSSTQIVEHSHLRPTMVLPLLVGTSGDVAAGTHRQSPAVSQDIIREAVSIAVETARREGV